MREGEVVRVYKRYNNWSYVRTPLPLPPFLLPPLPSFPPSFLPCLLGLVWLGLMLVIAQVTKDDGERGWVPVSRVFTLLIPCAVLTSRG